MAPGDGGHRRRPARQRTASCRGAATRITTQRRRPAADQRPADSRLEATTFTATPVSVTPNPGVVELILTGTGTVEGFGPATEVVGVVEDCAASPCGAGGASDTAQLRIVMKGGLLEMHESAVLCITASGPPVTATYKVDGQASTGIFAGARGIGHENGQRHNRPRNTLRDVDPHPARTLTGGRVFSSNGSAAVRQPGEKGEGPCAHCRSSGYASRR